MERFKKFATFYFKGNIPWIFFYFAVGFCTSISKWYGYVGQVYSLANFHTATVSSAL